MKGMDNRVADALFRREVWDEELSLSLLSIPTSSWVAKFKQLY
jgi:hypothetical protein